MVAGSGCAHLLIQRSSKCVHVCIKSKYCSRLLIVYIRPVHSSPFIQLEAASILSTCTIYMYMCFLIITEVKWIQSKLIRSTYAHIVGGTL